MIKFKEILSEAVSGMPRMPLSRAKIKEMMGQLRFYMKQKPPKPLYAPIVFKQGGSAPPAGYELAFYIRLVGGEKEVGKPSLEPLPPRNGIAYIDPKVFDKKYVYYLFFHLYQQGTWRPYAHGSTNLMTLKLSDLNSLKFVK